ncbi:hypothetical protein [Nocardia callitridis]|uniref:Uncharacterized protein n=1 Tax=Nocardia callitridis TaxID=648753 RepID=A0ABP9KIY7_9NOCA
MKLTAAVLGAVLGQRPDDAIRPVIDLIDNPTPGRAAYRGGKPVPFVVGPHDEQDAENLDHLAKGT